MIMKKTFLLTLIIILSCNTLQANQTDSLAIYILNRLKTNLQSFKSCSFTSQITYDVWTEELGLIKHNDTEDIYIQFPDKITVKTFGDKGRTRMIYTGKKFFMYSYNHTYTEVDISLSVIEMIHAINHNYGIEFPGADFFYPTFVEDMMASGGFIRYLGTTYLDGKECYHIAGKDSNGSNFQVWISEDYLPAKMVINYGNQTGSPQYEAIYKNWVTNPILPVTLFEFTPPPGATRISLISISSSK